MYSAVLYQVSTPIPRWQRQTKMRNNENDDDLGAEKYTKGNIWVHTHKASKRKRWSLCPSITRDPFFLGQKFHEREREGLFPPSRESPFYLRNSQTDHAPPFPPPLTPFK